MVRSSPTGKRRNEHRTRHRFRRTPMILGDGQGDDRMLIQGGSGRPVIGTTFRRPVVRCRCDALGCKNEVLEYEHIAIRTKRHFCSRDCYHSSKDAESNPKWRGGKKRARCPCCNRTFRFYGNTPQTYCSQQCVSDARVARNNQIWTVDYARQLLSDFRRSGLQFYRFAASLGWTEDGLRKRIQSVARDEFAEAVEETRLSWHEIYRRGRSFEYEVRRLLINREYVCMMSPRSEGPADLLAVKNGDILLIQCKCYGTLKKKERVQLIELARQAKGRAIVASKETGSPTFWEFRPDKFYRQEVTL
ncbi:MAG: hypothetical protein C0483_18450 [Pirellula sp.]|nr:hypothetical protein [Pirellula sp.]